MACLRPFSEEPSDYKETLLIGADQTVVAELAVYETMEPQTVTVPIDGCGQLMFWLANTYNTSGQYVFYDIRLTKERLPLSIPKEARLSQGVVTAPPYTPKELAVKWERPEFSGAQRIDAYISDCSYVYGETLRLIEDTRPVHKIYTWYLETASGEVCKAVSLKIDDEERLDDGSYVNVVNEYEACLEELRRLDELKARLTELSLSFVSANIALPELGFGAIAYSKVLKLGRDMTGECRETVDLMIEEKREEVRQMESWLLNARDIDGVNSTEYTILCPLSPGEEAPSEDLQLLSKFSVR